MGNLIGTQVCPMDQVCPYTDKTHTSCLKKPPKTKPKFGSIIRMCRFYPDPKDELFVQNTPLDLSEFTHFYDESCYIVLHLYLSPELLPLENNNSNNGSLPSPNSKLQLSAAELGVSAKMQLSPKGQRTSFSGIHSVAKSLQPQELNKNSVNYDIYIWHGKEVPPIVKANTLAQAFDIDKVMQNTSLSCALPLFYSENPSVVPLSSFLHLSDSLDEWKRQSENNHLFKWIAKLYLRDPTANHSSTPSPKRFSKNSRTHDDATSSNASPNRAPRSKISRKARGVPKERSNSKCLPDTKESKKRPDSSALKLQFDRLNFRSISLPAHEINRVCQLAEKLDSGGKDLKIDLSELPKGGSRDAPVTRVAPPESKASKIARCDRICSKIAESLFLGSDTIARDQHILKENGVTHILNCAGTICPNYHPNEFIYKKLYLCDGSKEDITSLFYDVLEFIDGAISSGGKVFVHCHQGISRSSAMLILYLMWKDNMDYQSTHERVKAIREVTNPNAGFTCQLLNWWSLHSAKKKKKRMFAVFPHCMKAPKQFILKELSKDQYNIQSLDPRGCFIIWTAKRLFLWVGKDCPPILEENGKKYAERIQKYENGPKPRIEYQGNESTRFTGVFSEYSPEVISTVESYNDSFDLLNVKDEAG